jgi:FSR family fosmidomycin resistance protein-like MFS transporter
MGVSSLRSVVANRALLALMTGHFINDMLVNVLPQLYPIAKNRFQVSNADLGLITLAYTIGSSFLQPFFGHLSDRLQNRWLAPSILAWSTVWISVCGLASSFWMLFGIATLAGIGSGAYHPLGASSASRISDPRVRNAALSIYTVAGSTGYAIGPLLAVAALGWLGASGTLMFLIPGSFGVLLLAGQMGNVMRHSARRAAIDVVETQQAIPYGALARIVGVVMLRSWSFLALIQFIPVWYDDLGYGRSVYGPLTTTMIAAGALGTLLGGALADRIGGRSVIIGSQLLCVPAILAFVEFPGAAAFVLGAAFGILSDSSLSVTLTAAQRLLPGRTGIASGVILGLGFITGGVGVPITGYIGDRWGIDFSLSLLALLCVGAALLAWTTNPRLYRGEPVYESGEALAGGVAP